MSKSGDILVSILDIVGFDLKWPVAISILSFGFLIINIIGFFYHYDIYAKILLSAIIPSSAFIPILFLIYIQGYCWKLSDIVTNLEKVSPDSMLQHIGFYMYWDVLGVGSGLAFGMLSIWAEPNAMVTISAFLFPMACLTISRAWIREGIVGRKIYDSVDKWNNTIRNSFSKRKN